MDQKNTRTIAALLLVLAVIFLVDSLVFQELYFTGIVAIIIAIVIMSLFIMQDSSHLPEIGIMLRDDARSVRVINRGNDTAFGVHVTLVPLNIEFDIQNLDADGTFEYQLPAMLAEAKAVVTYKNSSGREYTRTTRLSALGTGDEDLLKPMFPLFNWK